MKQTKAQRRKAWQWQPVGSFDTVVVVVERRVDPDDGGWYTREEFVAFYGGTTEWNAARPACTQCARCHGA